jgi:hypothetical protein
MWKGTCGLDARDHSFHKISVVGIIKILEEVATLIPSSRTSEA